MSKQNTQTAEKTQRPGRGSSEPSCAGVASTLPPPAARGCTASPAPAPLRWNGGHKCTSFGPQPGEERSLPLSVSGGGGYRNTRGAAATADTSRGRGPRRQVLRWSGRQLTLGGQALLCTRRPGPSAPPQAGRPLIVTRDPGRSDGQDSQQGTTNQFTAVRVCVPPIHQLETEAPGGGIAGGGAAAGVTGWSPGEG